MAQSGVELEIRITQGCPCAGMTDLEPGHMDLTWTAYIGAELDTSDIWKLIECGEFMQTQSTDSYRIGCNKRRHSSKRDKEGVDWDVQFGEGGEGKDPVAEGERSTWWE
ncbi:hypothetical protein V2W45_1348152 [Cenococcum geophilum]